MQQEETTPIVRRVRVDRNLTPKEVVERTGRHQYVISKHLLESISIPEGGVGDWVEVYFFPPGEEEADKALGRRGLVPDPRAVAQVNADDPEFASVHPNGTRWRDAKGHAYCMAFGEWEVGHVDERRYVRLSQGQLGPGVWVGGVKPPTE